jgi:trk system potassium uptake protein TrkH
MNYRGGRSHAAVRPRWLAVVLNVALALTALAAVAALVLEYGGFKLTADQLRSLHFTEAVIVAVFVTDRLLRFGLVDNRRQYLRENWIDFVLMALAAGVIAIRSQWQVTVMSAGAFYVLVTQAYILATLIVYGVSANLRFAGSGIHPSWLLMGSFAFLCLVGAGLLMLPAATPSGKPIGFHDALFTATSACCVTGLIVRPTGTEFTFFGQAVILGLIQLGGLGIISFGTMLALLVGKTFSLRTSTAVGHIVSAERIGGLGRLVLFILFSTFALESLGAVLNYPMFAAVAAEQRGTGYVAHPAWASVFHSISAFCNAGFSVYDENLMEGVRSGWGRALRDHWQILGVLAPLIVLGGLGFPVLYDCAAYGRAAVLRWVARLKAKRGWLTPGVPRPHLSLHARIVLAATLILIVGGAVGLLLVEPVSDAPRYGAIGRTPVYSDDTRHRRDWPRMAFEDRIRHAIFQSVSARTAGYNTIDLSELSDAGKLWMCGLMIIGGSPAGTAGGMKTITFALLLVTVYCVLLRRQEVEVFRRSLPAEMLGKVVTLAVLYLAWVGVITLLLCVAMRTGFGFIDLFFEVCSACGTVGLSTGVTGSLNLFGKIVIIAGMFVGRVGPLTVLLALTSKVRPVDYAYPRENVVIG